MVTLSTVNAVKGSLNRSYKNFTLKMNENLKLLLDSIGFGMAIASIITILWILITIEQHGKFIATEPNNIIRRTEIAIGFYAVLWITLTHLNVSLLTPKGTSTTK